MDHAVLVMRRDANSRVFVAGRCAADQQRNVHLQSLHLFGDVDHLVKARRDQTRKANHVDVVLRGFFQNLLARNHHAKVDDLVVVTAQNNANDVLSDVVNVTLNCRQQNLAAEALAFETGIQFFLLHERQQVRNRFLHHASRFHDLWKKHLPAAEEIANDRHPVHHWAFDDRKAFVVFQTRFFGIVDHIFVDALDQRMRKSFFNGSFSPC